MAVDGCGRNLPLWSKDFGGVVAKIFTDQKQNIKLQQNSALHKKEKKNGTAKKANAKIP